MRWLALVLAVAPPPLAEGTYKGTYRGSAEGSSGNITLSLRQAEGRWTAVFSFTAAGQDVPCKSTTLEPAGDKFKLVCAWEAQGYQLETVSEVTAAEDKLEGKYRTTVKSDSSALDEGSWSLRRETARP